MEWSRVEETDKIVVLITGCSSGIGEAIAREFGKKYAKNHIVYATARNTESLAELVEAFPEGVIRPLELDVTNNDSVHAAVKKVLTETGGRIDVLINNAGLSQYGPLLDIPIDDFQHLLDTNVIGPLRLVQEVAPSMINRRKGMIVNIGSVVGVISTPWSGPYCASKAAVHAWTNSLRMELAPFGIKVVVVAPGGVQSKINVKALRSDWGSSQFYSEITEYIALRAGSSQDKPMPATKFAENLVREVERAGGPKKEWYFWGRMSSLLPFIAKWLPFWLTDWIMMRRFGLLKLRSLLGKKEKEEGTSSGRSGGNSDNEKNKDKSDDSEKKDK